MSIDPKELLAKSLETTKVQYLVSFENHDQYIPIFIYADRLLAETIVDYLNSYEKTRPTLIGCGKQGHEESLVSYNEWKDKHPLINAGDPFKYCYGGSFQVTEIKVIDQSVQYETIVFTRNTDIPLYINGIRLDERARLSKLQIRKLTKEDAPNEPWSETLFSNLFLRSDGAIVTEEDSVDAVGYIDKEKETIYWVRA